MKENHLPENEISQYLNLVSGAHSASLADGIHANFPSIDALELTSSLLESFVTADKIPEAMVLIRSLFDVAEVQYPEAIAQLENCNVDVQKLFISELLMDLDEIITEYQFTEIDEENFDEEYDEEYEEE